jgi:hypothetical protein
VSVWFLCVRVRVCVCVCLCLCVCGCAWPRFASLDVAVCCPHVRPECASDRHAGRASGAAARGQEVSGPAPRHARPRPRPRTRARPRTRGGRGGHSGLPCALPGSRGQGRGRGEGQGEGPSAPAIAMAAPPSVRKTRGPSWTGATRALRPWPACVGACEQARGRPGVSVRVCVCSCLYVSLRPTCARPRDGVRWAGRRCSRRPCTRRGSSAASTSRSAPACTRAGCGSMVPAVGIRAGWAAGVGRLRSAGGPADECVCLCGCVCVGVFLFVWLGICVCACTCDWCLWLCAAVRSLMHPCVPAACAVGACS